MRLIDSFWSNRKFPYLSNLRNLIFWSAFWTSIPNVFPLTMKSINIILSVIFDCKLAWIFEVPDSDQMRNELHITSLSESNAHQNRSRQCRSFGPLEEKKRRLQRVSAFCLGQTFPSRPLGGQKNNHYWMQLAPKIWLPIHFHLELEQR